MATYKVTLDVWNHRQGFPSQRVTLMVDGWNAKDARSHIGTVYVSRDGKLVNNTGAVGWDGYFYQEWEIVRQRKVPSRPLREDGYSGYVSLHNDHLSEA